jgi:hypothetical protein
MTTIELVSNSHQIFLKELSNSDQDNKPAITPSQDAMLEHIAYLVLHENRPASWHAFQKFMLNDKEY